MPIRKLGHSEHGLTLVEVLASITILGIIFLAFVSIFPHMTAVNIQTEEKLQTMNLAKIELTELQSKYGKEQILSYSKNIDNEDAIVFSTYKNGYEYEITYDKNADLDEHEGFPETVPLYQIHIKVMKAKKIISETFGYVQYEL